MSLTPRIVNVGLSGVLVSFSDRLSETANRAALAFRAALEGDGLAGVIETSTSLTSTFIAYDPTTLSNDRLQGHLRDLVASRDWSTAPLPQGRRLWQMPAAFEGPHAPQLAEVADLAGISTTQAVADLSETRLRVMTIGFAPGQPYLGEMPAAWDIPRQSGLTKEVPIGALAAAIRQLVMFTTLSPTGWRQVGQTTFRGFRQEANTPFPLRPGDEICFTPIPPRDFARLAALPHGGATPEALE